MAQEIAWSASLSAAKESTVVLIPMVVSEYSGKLVITTAKVIGATTIMAFGLLMGAAPNFKLIDIKIITVNPLMWFVVNLIATDVKLVPPIFKVPMFN